MPSLDFPIIDAHVHLYQAEHLRYPWLDNLTELRRPFLVDDYAEAIGTAPVEQFVFVEVAAHIDDAIDEARWVDALSGHGEA